MLFFSAFLSDSKLQPETTVHVEPLREPAKSEMLLRGYTWNDYLIESVRAYRPQLATLRQLLGGDPP
jgi:hypothetical protein